MTTNKTTLIAIISVLFVLFSLAVVSWVVYEVETAGKMLGERVLAIANTNAKIKAYNELFELVETTKIERETLTDFVLTEDKTGSFLTDIENLGASNNVSLTTNSLQVVKGKDKPDTLNVQFALSGAESSVKKMLQLFETLPYHSSVSSLLFTRKDGNFVEGTVTLDITLLKI